MSVKTSIQTSIFEKVLQAFEFRDVPYTDVQFHLKRLLENGASPKELVEVLRRHEVLEPLPEYAHEEVLRVLDEAIESAAAKNTSPDATDAEYPGLDSEPAQVRPEDDAAAQPLAESAPSAVERIALQDASAAGARAIALAAELAAARAALESEQSKSWETNRAAAERIASSEAAHSRSEAALSRSDAALLRSEAALSHSATMLRELEREHAKTESALESCADNRTRLQAELQASRAQDLALAAELTALRAALAAEQRKTREMSGALAEKIALHDAAVSRGDNVLRGSERYQAELRVARESLGELDGQLARQQREHVKVVAELEARVQALESQLQSAASRIEEMTLELRANQDAVVSHQAQRERSESYLISVQTQLDAVQQRSDSYLETLRTREWRRRFDQDGPLLAERDELRAQLSHLQKERKPHEGSVEPAAAGPSRSAPDGRRKSINRTFGVGAALAVLAVVVWFLMHSVPGPAKVPPAATVTGSTPGTVIRDCPRCPAMTVLAAGRFQQGSDRADAASFQKPQRWVAIGLPIAMSTNAVTVEEFSAFIAATGRAMPGCDTYDGAWKHRPDNSWENPGFVQSASHPVTCVSWSDAKAYATWLSATTGHQYRLPSASEWEYAARAGGEAVLPWNPDGSDACANANVADDSAAHRFPGWTVFACSDGYVYTAPVASFKASAFGLHDMLGNVFQWTEDCWHADYAGAPVDGSARMDGECSEHELRGGSWYSSPPYVRADYRNHFEANYRTSSVGIRLVREMAP